jgi:DNA-binding transcriptional ArsR family regulator
VTSLRRDIFQALADPTRRNIIQLIAGKPLTLNGVADSFDVSRQAVAKHIKILEECGVITIASQGRERYCYIQPEKLNEVSEWLADFTKRWNHTFTRLDGVLNNMQTKPTTKE